MAAIDIEYELEKMFVTTFRGIFEFDQKFVYNKNEQESLIAITSEYPETDVPLQSPHLVVTGISYQFNMMNSLTNNFYREYMTPEGLCSEYLNIIPYSINIACLGEIFVSKDLANKVINYVSFEMSEVFEGLGLNIMNISKGPTTPQSQYPDKVFETVVSIQGKVDWKGTKVINSDIQKVVGNIKQELSLLK